MSTMTDDSSATLTDILIAQGRLEAKIDSFTRIQVRHEESLDSLCSRVNDHSRLIAGMQSSLAAQAATHENSVSRGLVIITLVVSIVLAVATLIFNLINIQ